MMRLPRMTPAKAPVSSVARIAIDVRSRGTIATSSASATLVAIVAWMVKGSAGDTISGSPAQLVVPSDTRIRTGLTRTCCRPSLPFAQRTDAPSTKSAPTDLPACCALVPGDVASEETLFLSMTLSPPKRASFPVTASRSPSAKLESAPGPSVSNGRTAINGGLSDVARARHTAPPTSIRAMTSVAMSAPALRLTGALRRGNRPLDGLLSAARRSAPLGGRIAARFDRQRITRSAMWRGTLELVFVIGRGVSDICADNTSWGEVLSAKGCFPEINS